MRRWQVSFLLALRCATNLRHFRLIRAATGTQHPKGNNLESVEKEGCSEGCSEESPGLLGSVGLRRVLHHDARRIDMDEARLYTLQRSQKLDLLYKSEVGAYRHPEMPEVDKNLP